MIESEDRPKSDPGQRIDTLPSDSGEPEAHLIDPDEHNYYDEPRNGEVFYDDDEVYAPGWESFIEGIPSHITFARLK